MPRLYITEVATLGQDFKGVGSLFLQMPPVSGQTVEITDESATCQPFSRTTAFVLLVAEADCSIAWGEVATKDHGLLPAGVDRIVAVEREAILSVIANTEE